MDILPIGPSFSTLEAIASILALVAIALLAAELVSTWRSPLTATRAADRVGRHLLRTVLPGARRWVGAAVLALALRLEHLGRAWML